MSSPAAGESASQLTDLQLAILRVLWTRGSATAAEITEALRDERGLAHQTIATVLSRLERRGIVRHRTRQRQYVYLPEISEREVRRSMLADLTDRLFEGDVAALVTHLLSAREISRGDLARVRKLIAAHESKRGT
jgi:predicted transcriptional regulator